MNDAVLTLAEATISVYPAKPDGSPDLTRAILREAEANGLRVGMRPIRAEHRPTGRRSPRNRNLLAQWEVTMDRLWMVGVAGDTDDLNEEGCYVLDVTWLDEDEVRWRRETFYGVTVETLDRQGSLEFAEAVALGAERRVTASGTTLPIPQIADTEPILVKYFSPSVAEVNIYRYDEDTGLFTEYEDGSAAGRATISQGDTSIEGTEFTIAFDGQETPVLAIGEGFALQVTGMSNRICREETRLEFWQGPLRLAALGVSGMLHAYAFTEATAEQIAEAGGALVMVGAEAVLALVPAGVLAQEFDAMGS